MCIEALSLVQTKSEHVFSELVEIVLDEDTGDITKALISQYLLQKYSDYIERSLTSLVLREQLVRFSSLESGR